jgi:hypothetical protein
MRASAKGKPLEIVFRPNDCLIMIVFLSIFRDSGTTDNARQACADLRIRSIELSSF